MIYSASCTVVRATSVNIICSYPAYRKDLVYGKLTLLTHSLSCCFRWRVGGIGFGHLPLEYCRYVVLCFLVLGLFRLGYFLLHGTFRK